MEYPRYRQFAQSFPTVIPFSEGLGFILDVEDSTNVDIPFFITAHEVAHQWWGLNLVAANVVGKNFILETLAQYSALMVLKSSYGDGKVRQFLAIQEAQYHDKARADSKNEKSLALVEKEKYLYYNKGAVAMYEMQHALGELATNTALKRFLEDWNSNDGVLVKERFPTTGDLLEYFKLGASEQQVSIIEELIEEVWTMGECLYWEDSSS
jgi:aminopeptidase N